MSSKEDIIKIFKNMDKELIDTLLSKITYYYCYYDEYKKPKIKVLYGKIYVKREKRDDEKVIEIIPKSMIAIVLLETRYEKVILVFAEKRWEEIRIQKYEDV